LAYLQLGREPEAKADFTRGSDLEADDVYKFYNVSKALARVQGNLRMQIEQYRAQARVKAAKKAKKLRQARYEDLRVAEARILQEQATAAPDTSVAKPTVTKDDSDPFTAGPLDEPQTKAAAKSSATPKPVQADPFAATPAETTKKAPAKKGGGILKALGKAVGKTAKDASASLPKLGGADTKPAASEPQPTKMDKEDPFSEKSFSEDPFSTEPAEEQPKAEQPAEEPEESDPEDPFG
jgi:hypothetical protein